MPTCSQDFGELQASRIRAADDMEVRRPPAGAAEPPAGAAEPPGYLAAIDQGRDVGEPNRDCDESRGTLEIRNANAKKPAVRRFVNIKTFTILACASLLMHTIAFAVQTSTITTVQKAYGLSTLDAGIWFSAYVVGEVISGVFVSYFAGQSRKPRVVAIGMMVTAVTCFAHAIPHFIYPYLSGTEAGETANNYYEGVCVPASSVLPTNSSRSHLGETGHSPVPCSDAGARKDVVLGVYIAATVLMGLGYGPLPVLPVVYMDDNAGGRNKASFYQSCFYGVYYLGPVIGYSAAAATLSVYVDLTEVNFTEEDTYWVGAWWLGYLGCAAGILILSVPMFFFPASLADEDAATSLPASTEMIQTEQQLEAKDVSASSSSVSDDGYKEGLPSARLFLPTLWSFIKNPVYVLTTLTMCTNAWVEAGFFSYLPKYLEVQFYQSASIADIETGVCGSLASAVGVLAGGWVVSRFKLTLNKCVVMLCTAYFLGSLLYVTATFFSCSQYVANYDVVHNSSYDCSSSEYYPVCVDKVSYYSPCHAGCQNETVDENKKVILLDCLCGTLRAESGVCSDACESLIPYLVMIVLAYGFPSFAYMAGITILLRCVNKENRSFSLGIHAECLSLIGWIPAPMLYGAVIDTTCLTWERVGVVPDHCLPTEEEGSCLQYDNYGFRMSMHALTYGAMILGFLLAAVNCLIMYLNSKHQDTQYTEDEGTPEVQSIVDEKAEMPEDLRVYNPQPS